ncbi:hypothetical protein ACFQE7_01530 [Nonomuraea ferruginea]|uniref:hypothetical protein n=1 Tax=Nonomuraea ferruginea TaxID=46174 RepID=UPI00360E20BB
MRKPQASAGSAPRTPAATSGRTGSPAADSSSAAQSCTEMIGRRSRRVKRDSRRG